ncbi:MAG: methyltransferase domain-containing protein [Caulobacterales bacterium]|nr:methyltransferase domain-containing protein [Caulobacterales bacterium]
MSRARLLSLVDVARQRGLEIGPLNRPIVTRAMGPVEYIDRAPRSELAAWYGAADVDPDEIVEVDHVWGDQSLFDCVGGQRAYDYLIASHVIEHVPDVFGWLGEIATVLVDGGLGLFIVPDKRHTFDVLRPTSASGEFVDAHLRRLRRPDLRQIFNHVYEMRLLDGPQSLDEAARTERAQGALAVCRQALETQAYIDVHCWVFTPRSALEALDLASRLGLLPYEIAALELAPGEFLLALRRLPEAMPADAQRTAFLASVQRLDLPQEAPGAGSDDAAVLLAKAEVATARAAAIENSTTWKLTAPLRAAVDRVRRRA